MTIGGTLGVVTDKGVKAERIRMHLEAAADYPVIGGHRHR